MIYALAFDIAKPQDADTTAALTEEELRTEYNRLSACGYPLYQASYWKYTWNDAGEKQQEIVPVVVGMFTEKQLADFQAKEAYSYFFYFRETEMNHRYGQRIVI